MLLAAIILGVSAGQDVDLLLQSAPRDSPSVQQEQDVDDTWDILDSPRLLQQRSVLVAQTAAGKAGCSTNSEDCRETKCCLDPAKRCYVKDDYWGGCLSNCTQGNTNPGDDPQYRTPWKCEQLAPAPDCSKDTEDCREKKCCLDSSKQCYVKNDHWGGCLSNCTPGNVHPGDADEYKTPWKCEIGRAHV